MKNSIIWTLLLLIFGIWIACNENGNPSPGNDYTDGVFVVNEGNYGDADASLSFYSVSSGEVSNNIFSLANPEMAIGDVFQSAYIHDDAIYMVVNNSNKIEVADLSEGMKHLRTIDSLLLPRYMTVHENKGYVAEWVSFTTDGRVSVFDPATGVVENRVSVGPGAEHLLISGGRLFVSNSFSNTLSVIALTSLEVEDTLEVGNSPGLMVEDVDGDIWLVCAGGFGAGDGKLFEIDPQELTIENEIDLGQNVSSKIAVNPQGTAIYYLASVKVYEFSVSSEGAPVEPLINESEATDFYGIGVDADGTIYLADSKAFAASGEVSRYDEEGNLLGKFPAGRGPNGFVFR